MYPCPVCGQELKDESATPFQQVNMRTCKHCGQYFAPSHWEYGNVIQEYNRSEVKSYLFYHFNPRKRIYLGKEELFNQALKKGLQDCYYVSPEMVHAWYPRTFAEKNDRLLLFLQQQLNYVGAEFDESLIEKGAFFDYDSNIHQQLRYIIDYLISEEYLKKSKDSSRQYVIMPKGLARIESLQKSQENNKNVFVAMSFASNMAETRNAIKEGIKAAGYSPEFMDEIIHNHQIVPEMFRLIRESRFLIMDISEPNFGAYYEAGYAYGLGKEVIISCKEDVFYRKYETDEEVKYQKYLKPHFDIAQKQILVWGNYEDLSIKLREWIRSIIG